MDRTLNKHQVLKGFKQMCEIEEDDAEDESDSLRSSYHESNFNDALDSDGIDNSDLKSTPDEDTGSTIEAQGNHQSEGSNYEKRIESLENKVEKLFLVVKRIEGTISQDLEEIISHLTPRNEQSQ